MEQVQGWSEAGGTSVVVPGTQGSGSQRFQQSFRGCTVTVRDSSNNLATIYSDDLASPTAKANPFTSSSTTGSWSFFITPGTYSVTFSGGSIAAPFSITVNVGLGNAGGVPSYAYASLPASKTQNAGDIARVTDTQGGLWMDGGVQWAKVNPVVNVQDAPFNCRPDGSTDALAGITAALATGYDVYFPAGVYKTSAKVIQNTNFQKVFSDGPLTVIWGDHTDYVWQCGNGTTERLSMELSSMVLWSPTGKGLIVNKVNRSRISNINAWSAGIPFTIKNESIINKFSDFTASSNLASSFRTKYAVLPAITNNSVGLSVEMDSVECNALLFSNTIIEGVASHGIVVTGTHIDITFLNPTSEGNGGYGYYLDGDTGFNSNVKLINAYHEANTLGALYAESQQHLIVDGGRFGVVDAAADGILLTGVCFSKFSNFSVGRLTVNTGTLPNVTDAPYFSTSNSFKNIVSVGVPTGTAWSNKQAIEQCSFGVFGSQNEVSHVDISSLNILTVNSATPAINRGNVYQTNNTNPTTYTNLTGAFSGQRIRVYIRDANTTVDFTSTNLFGNGGQDWFPSSGDWMDGEFDGTNWYFIVSGPGYRQGTWTPALSIAGITITTATYTRIGRQVTILLDVTWPATGDGGAAVITGLPFTPSSFFGLSAGLRPAITVVGIIQGGAAAGGTIALFTDSLVATTNAQMSTTRFIASGTYFV